MASYNARPRPTVSEYIANLNTIPTAHEMASRENFNAEEELAMFTNSQFFDFDMPRDAANFELETPPSTAAASHAGSMPMATAEFMPNDFSFPDFASFPPHGYHAEGMPPMAHGMPAHNVYPLSASASPQANPSMAGVDKRKSDVQAADVTRAAMSFEEASRMAAEEDKRRRNTAASARFRVKKKQREAALERSAKEMSEKVAVLEGRINQLETENKWLKNLITEKNENKDDIASLWKKFSQESADRKGTDRKDGVGTIAALKA